MVIPRKEFVEVFEFVGLVALFFLANLYFLEYRGSLKEAHAAVWKRPKRWQLMVACILWGLIIASVAMIICFRKPN